MRAQLLAGMTVLVSVSAFAADCPVRDSWPTQSWPQSLAQGKATQIKAMEDYAFTLTGADGDRKGVRTDSVVIIKGGNIAYERYARGWDASKRHISWSVAKSISSALIGVGVNVGLINIGDSICDYLTDFSGDTCKIHVKDVLMLATGLQWQEEYENRSYQVSSVISMLFGVGHNDQVRLVLTGNQLVEPGSRFNYSTGDAHVLATIANTALTKRYGPDAMWSQLFDRIGMTSTVFEQDTKGNTLGGSFAFATSRDYARLGYLYLNDGCWEGQRILPDGWVKSSTTPNEAFVKNRGDCSGAPETADTFKQPCEDTPNGYMWWENKPPADGVARPYPDVPDDLFLAIGHWGQYIYVIPSLDTVIVRTGDDRDDTYKTNDFLKLALEVVR